MLRTCAVLCCVRYPSHPSHVDVQCHDLALVFSSGPVIPSARFQKTRTVFRYRHVARENFFWQWVRAYCSTTRSQPVTFYIRHPRVVWDTCSSLAWHLVDTHKRCCKVCLRRSVRLRDLRVRLPDSPGWNREGRWPPCWSITKHHTSHRRRNAIVEDRACSLT
jgi:hypothetical protein